MRAMPVGPFVEHDPAWGDLRTWRAILSARHEYTPRYLLAAVDLERRAGGSIGPAPAEQRVHVQLLAQTLWISLVVTLLCLAIGYPLAYTMASLPGRWGALLLVVVLLPFWTSALVRTAAWMVLLRKDGVINTIFLALGVAAEPFELIFNRFSVYVAMVYVMLPFMVLPLYSAMRSIDPGQVRAAESLGARPPVAFFTVYLPQTAPGVSAGSILVFIQTLGFYVTPAPVGGRQDQMISMVIANYALGTANWNMAAAVSVVLLVCIALVYPIFTRFAGTAPLGIR
ncbi:MAG: ABC transporter permease [Gammaproteobacteria bacterium]|nr:ABC transporter permease [Gammaproteobacteria bacterium]